MSRKHESEQFEPQRDLLGTTGSESVAGTADSTGERPGMSPASLPSSWTPLTAEDRRLMNQVVEILEDHEERQRQRRDPNSKLNMLLCAIRRNLMYERKLQPDHDSVPTGGAKPKHAVQGSRPPSGLGRTEDYGGVRGNGDGDGALGFSDGQLRFVSEMLDNRWSNGRLIDIREVEADLRPGFRQLGIELRRDARRATLDRHVLATKRQHPSYSNRRIAKRLDCSPDTVDRSVKRLQADGLWPT